MKRFCLILAVIILLLPAYTKAAEVMPADSDQDGLSDVLELKFGTDPQNPDSDGDGYKDGEEVSHYYDPAKADCAKLKKSIIIDTAKQKLYYLLNGVEMGSFTISSGKPSMPTPKGAFKVINKSPKAWSRAYGLWMPYWVGLGTGRIGIHELPIWPNGYREGEDHLGKPVSHGCIRLGVNSAKIIYDFAEVGMEVVIK